MLFLQKLRLILLLLLDSTHLQALIFLNIFSTENLQIRKNRSTFASLSEKERAFSSAGSEHLPYKQRVGGSNPSTPTLPRPLQRSFLLSNILQSSKQITLRFKNWKEQIVGYLHDAAEDTPHTVSETIHLLQDKCPNIATKDWEEIETALNLMNSHTAANREAYINRFRNNTLAIRVKLNDLRHNMDISRIHRRQRITTHKPNAHIFSGHQ